MALAAVRDGQSRAEAARIGGMDRQTLRDWVHAYNDRGIAGLVNDTSPGRPPKLAAEHKQALKELVEKGPDPETDGVVRWRRIDLARIAKTTLRRRSSTRTRSAASCANSAFPTSACARSIPSRRTAQLRLLKKLPRQAR